MPASAGHHARVSYLWEDDSSGNPDFATDSPDDTDYKPFGSDATLSTLEGSNNAIAVFDPNSREAREVIEQNFQGSWSVEFTLTNPWFLRMALHNEVSTTGSTEPYTHSFDGDIPFSSRIVQGTETTGNERVLKGCVASSVSMSASLGGMVQVTIDGAYADEETESVGVSSLQGQPTIQERPLHFGEATVSRDGSTLSLIQEASLSIENNIDLIGELGTRFSVDYSPKKRNVSITYGDIVENDDELKRMYGDSASTSPGESVENTQNIVFKFDNGKTGTDKNSLTMTLEDAFPDSYGRSGIGDPEADLEGTLDEIVVGRAASCPMSGPSVARPSPDPTTTAFSEVTAISCVPAATGVNGPRMRRSPVRAFTMRIR